MPKNSFRADLHALRPDVLDETRRNETKRKLAMALRALRKQKGMTQKDVERNSTLTQPMISRLEAPTGPLPNWETVMRYVEACDGHMLVGFSGQEFDEADYVGDRSDGHDMVAAVAV